MSCEYVKSYLDNFLDQGARRGFDVERVSDHVQTCRPCYEHLGRFFRTIELPESSYLRETIDELCLAMYHFARSVLRERHDPDDNTDNVVPVTGELEGSARDHADYGREMIEDAEDFAGSSEVEGCNLEGVREVLDRAVSSRDRKVDLALLICDEVTRFNTRHLPSVFNFQGVLRLWRNQLAEAEAAFLRTLGAPDTDEAARVARAFAHCNLGYVRQLSGDLDRAVQSARRSIALSEELGVDTFHGLFALFYFHLLRPAGAGLPAAREALARLLALEGGPARVAQTLGLENNQPIKDAFRRSDLAADHPDLV